MYLDLSSKQKRICFECLLRWYTIEAEQGVRDRSMPTLSMELDEFLSIEERYRRSSRETETVQKTDIIINLEDHDAAGETN